MYFNMFEISLYFSWWEKIKGYKLWTDPGVSAIAFHCTWSNLTVYGKKDYCDCISLKSPMILFIYGLKKGLRYSDLIFDFFERLIYQAY